MNLRQNFTAFAVIAAIGFVGGWKSKPPYTIETRYNIPYPVSSCAGNYPMPKGDNAKAKKIMKARDMLTASIPASALR